MENVKIACVSNPNTRVTDMLREQLANPNADFPEIKLNCTLLESRVCRSCKKLFFSDLENLFWGLTSYVSYDIITKVREGILRTQLKKVLRK